MPFKSFSYRGGVQKWDARDLFKSSKEKNGSLSEYPFYLKLPLNQLARVQ